MKLAILLWIYKEPELCANRACVLRKLNPDIPIYVLFGGNLADSAEYEDLLRPWVDDFYAFPEPWTAQRKWLHGDQLIAAWHCERGRGFSWDTLFIAQWDLLLLRPLPQLCGTLRPDQLILPGLRPVREVADFWWWVRPGSTEGDDYARFSRSLGANFPSEPLCCNFVAGALPRRFLELYAALAAPDLGFLEYKMSIWAQVWGFGFCRDHAFQLAWETEKGRIRGLRRFDVMHAGKAPVSRALVALNSALPWGRRAIHPFHELWSPRLTPSVARRRSA